VDFSNFFAYPTGDSAGGENELVFLADLADEDWERLLTLTQVARYRAGEIVVRQGDAQRTLYIVGAGQLEVVVPKGHSRANAELQRVAAISEGSVFGEQAFLDGRARSATVRATTDCELHMLHHEAFESLAANEPRLAHVILMDLGRILSLRLRDATRVISAWVG
jgi:CRP/FNR family cyclic AMP-dependent transcriptional regulator